MSNQTDFKPANPFPFSPYFPATREQYYDRLCRERWEYVTAYKRDFCDPKYVRHRNRYYVRLPVSRDEKRSAWSRDLVERFDTSRWPKPTADERKEWRLDEGSDEWRQQSLAEFNRHRARKRFIASQSAPSDTVIDDTIAATDPDFERDLDPEYLEWKVKEDQEHLVETFKFHALNGLDAALECARSCGLPPETIEEIRAWATPAQDSDKYDRKPLNEHEQRLDRTIERVSGELRARRVEHAKAELADAKRELERVKPDATWWHDPEEAQQGIRIAQGMVRLCEEGKLRAEAKHAKAQAEAMKAEVERMKAEAERMKAEVKSGKAESLNHTDQELLDWFKADLKLRQSHAKHGSAQQHKVSATPFVLRDPRLIPPREWLYGNHYARNT
jgi:hypothetical protein